MKTFLKCLFFIALFGCAVVHADSLISVLPSVSTITNDDRIVINTNTLSAPKTATITSSNFLNSLKLLSNWPAGGSSGTVVSLTTTSIANAIPVYSNTSGTNITASDVSFNSTALQIGTNSAAPTAKVIIASGPRGGTDSNTAGASTTIAGSPGTGTGAGGSLLLATSPAGSTGSATNASVTALTLASTGAATFVAGITFGQGSAFLSSGRSVLVSPADGTWRMQNNGGNGFTTLQLGNDDSSPDAIVNVRGANGVGTDIIGGAVGYDGGGSTGTGAGGDSTLRTTFSAKSTGSTANTKVDRFRVVAKGKVLTSGAAASLFEVALPTLTMCGGKIEATIVCTDGTDVQSFTQTIVFSVVNKGGSYTKQIVVDPTDLVSALGAKAASAGTLTTAWSLLDGTNKTTIQLTPTTSLTASSNSFLVYYTVTNNSEQAITVLP